MAAAAHPDLHNRGSHVSAGGLQHICRPHRNHDTKHHDRRRSSRERDEKRPHCLTRHGSPARAADRLRRSPTRPRPWAHEGCTASTSAAAGTRARRGHSMCATAVRHRVEPYHGTTGTSACDAAHRQAHQRRRAVGVGARALPHRRLNTTVAACASARSVTSPSRVSRATDGSDGGEVGASKPAGTAANHAKRSTCSFHPIALMAP